MGSPLGDQTPSSDQDQNQGGEHHQPFDSRERSPRGDASPNSGCQLVEGPGEDLHEADHGREEPQRCSEDNHLFPDHVVPTETDCPDSQ